jgi:hypothetical protein
MRPMSYNKIVQTSQQGYFYILLLFRGRIEPINGHPYSKTIGFYLCSWSEQSRVRMSFYVGIRRNERMSMKARSSEKPNKVPRIIFIIFIVIIGIILVSVASLAINASLERQRTSTEVQKASDDKASTQAKATYTQCIASANQQFSDAVKKLTGLDGADYAQAVQSITTQIDSDKNDCDRYYKLATQ